jgi:peptidoglycan hydrolase CwlO-like protein
MHHSFDTHSAVKRFILSGLKEEQAEAIVQTIYESRDYDLSNLATKTDLIETEKKLDDKISKLAIDIANVRGEIAQVRTEIEKGKNETLKWFIGIAITLVGTMTGIMTLLFRYFLQ